MDETLVLAFPEYAAPAQRLAAALGCPCANVGLHRFPDGESLVRLPESPPRHVILCRTLDHPNDKLVEVLMAAGTARALGVERLTLVAPYLCYMRQDKAFHPGEAVSQRILGELLGERFDAVITVDAHLHRVSSLGEVIPDAQAVNLSTSSLLVERLMRRRDHPLVLGPDEESLQWVRSIAEAAGLEYDVASKQRHSDHSVTVKLPATDFSGRTVVLVDDVVSTGHTVAAAATGLKERGASRVDVLITHPLLAPGAEQLLEWGGVDTLCSSDSIPHPSNRAHLAELLAAAIRELGSGVPGDSLQVDGG